MTLDKKVNVELLKKQRGDARKDAVWNILIGIPALGVGAFTYNMGSLVLSANYNPPTPITNQAIADVGYVIIGGVMVAFGLLEIVRAALADHRANQLDDRIAEIEQSQQYKKE